MRLLTGLTLCRFDIKARGLSELASWIDTQRITILPMGVSIFRAFVASLRGDEKFPDVRALHLSFDRVLLEDVEAYRKHFSDDCIVFHSLSTTETHRVTAFFLDKSTFIHTFLPVGYALEDQNIVLLDDDANEVAVGAVGEIAVRSRSLSPGYWRKPELTKAKFIRKSDDENEVCYLTGDLGRMSEDGCLTHLGRKDLRVKVRGFSVEVVEIESALQEHKAVKEAVVSGVEDPTGEVQLAAYVVPRNSFATTDALRTFLKGKLPDYMVPSVFVMMDALPLTANGKVDRRALPEPDWTARHIDTPFVAPRNNLEARVVGIWNDVLGVEQIGINDNFFELGGHSLTGARVISRVLDVFQVQLPVREFFESPTVAATVEFITQAGEVEQGVISARIVPSGHDGHAPLSFAQQRLWFLDQLEPNNSFWNLPSSLRLRGELDVAVLEASLNEITKRHESLRTTFCVVDGEPVQVIHPDRPLVVHRVDLTGLEQEVWDSEVERLVHAETHRPFDLTRGPLFKVRLMELAGRENILFYNMHHIISDGWSSGNLMRELGTLMESFREGRASLLEDLPVQYADYAVWERDWLQGEVLDQHLEYWREHLTGAPPFLELPSDRPRPRAETFRGERYPWELSVELSRRLRELSRREGTTVFMTLLTAFNLLLYRLTGQGDLVVGMVSANRTQIEVEELIGFFVNVLPLRTRVEGGISFRELLGVVRRNCLAAYEHQSVPFEKIVEDQHPIRDLSHAPVFQVVFDMANPRVPIELPGLSVERIRRRFGPAKYDLVFHASEGERIEFAADYSTDLFDGLRIEMMMRQLEGLLEQIVGNPGEGIGSYSLVDEEMRGLLPDPTKPLDAGWVGAVHTLFSEQARKDPERLAVIDTEDRWTYGELDRRSNQLARYLISEGIQRGDIVAIYGHHSASLVWGLLGVLKAGAAFLLLDPQYSAPRNISYLSSARPRGWVQMEAAGDLPEEFEDHIATIPCRLTLPGLLTAAYKDFLEDYLSEAPRVEVGPNDLACVGYTSGSTGEPKGVLERHGPITHFFSDERVKYGWGHQDSFILISGLAHILVQREVFTPLCMGARVYIPSDAHTVEVVFCWIEREAITVLWATPGRARMLYESRLGALPSLRVLVLHSDELSWTDVRNTREWAPNALVIGVYGTTEGQFAIADLIVSRRGEMSEGTEQSQESVPLGQGVKDAQYLVLSEAGMLAGIGELGWLYTRSPHLAQGYLGDEALTAERFVQNPMTEDSDDRLYKTLDRVRYRPDGRIQFVGRGENTVNIRAYRVELGDVEAVLRRHGGVRGATVIARQFGDGSNPDDLRLVGYVVLDATTSLPEVRQFMRQQLPEYMVPSYFESLESLPLTAIGKVDRAALPEPEWRRPELGSLYVGPRTETEEVVAGIWVELLHLDRVGVHDNFFELGGHSLLATQVLQRMRDALKVDLPLRSLFESPTVADLAELIDAMQWAVETPDDASNQSTEEETF